MNGNLQAVFLPIESVQIEDSNFSKKVTGFHLSQHLAFFAEKIIIRKKDEKRRIYEKRNANLFDFSPFFDAVTEESV